jgi:hypothetical protein
LSAEVTIICVPLFRKIVSREPSNTVIVDEPNAVVESYIVNAIAVSDTTWVVSKYK